MTNFRTTKCQRQFAHHYVGRHRYLRCNTGVYWAGDRGGSVRTDHPLRFLDVQNLFAGHELCTQGTWWVNAVKASQLNGSVPLLVIRGISDRADSGKQAADEAGWQHRAAAHAADSTCWRARLS